MKHITFDKAIHQVLFKQHYLLDNMYLSWKPNGLSFKTPVSILKINECQSTGQYIVLRFSLHMFIETSSVLLQTKIYV